MSVLSSKAVWIGKSVQAFIRAVMGTQTFGRVYVCEFDILEKLRKKIRIKSYR